MHAGVLDEGSKGEANHPRGAQAPAGALQGSPLPGREEGHVSASSPVTKPQGLRDLLPQNKIMSARPQQQPGHRNCNARSISQAAPRPLMLPALENPEVCELERLRTMYLLHIRLRQPQLPPRSLKTFSSRFPSS